MKFVSILLLSLFEIVSFAAKAEGIPFNQWTTEEQEWVNEARTLYEKQGIEFNDAQAEEAVFKMRNKAVKGVPPSEWTPMEQKMVSEMRAMYQKNNMSLTPEQEQIQVQTMREKIAKLNGSLSVLKGLANGSIKPVTNESPEVESVTNSNTSETDLATRISQYPTLEGNLEIESKRDGFSINGQPILDPEGRIVSYSYDVMTGDITYLAESSGGFLIKYLRANSPDEPILISKATNSNRGNWDVTTVTGKKLTGMTLTMAPKGFMVARDSSAFKYIPGEGVQNVSIPDGYLLAPLQHGNTGATGYVLLEKIDNPRKDKGKALLNSFKSLGATLGLNKKEDYALMEMSSGKLYPLNISTDGKTVVKLSNCRKRSTFINECSNAKSFQSIYSQDGSPNMGHYYWLANWFNTPSGPISVTMENGVSKIYITDLTTGKKVVGFSRKLGIQNFSVKQFGDGHVSLVASWAFTKHEIADIEKHLAETESEPLQ